MIGTNREQVVWVGGPVPTELGGVVDVLGLRVKAVMDTASIDIGATDLFAVIVSAIGTDADKALGRLVRLTQMHALDYGLLLGIASPDLAVAITLRSQLIDKYGDAQVGRAPIVALGVTPSDFARALRFHDAGPPRNPEVELPLPGHIPDYDHYDSDGILLQRAFAEFGRLKLIPQEGGYSKDCKVWRVDAYRSADAPCEPFVAKAARRQDLEEEFRTYCDLVRNSIPFPFRAPLLEAQFVKGATRAVLVSAFVNRSERLDKYLAAVSSPELVMVSLFEEALGNWRRAATSEPVSLAGHSGLVPDPKNLRAAFRQSQKENKELLTPSELCDRLAKLPVGEHLICRVHGDLNIRNVFVRSNTTDTVLIDFSNSGSRGSLARDPSRLDTSISLMARDSEKKLLSETVLSQLYRGRLLPPRNFVAVDGRTDAIRQIRRHAGGEGISSFEYEILTICHLLRFACNPTSPEWNTPEMRARRALSYSLACGLVRNLEMGTPVQGRDHETGSS